MQPKKPQVLELLILLLSISQVLRSQASVAMLSLG